MHQPRQLFEEAKEELRVRPAEEIWLELAHAAAVSKAHRRQN